MKKRIGLLLAFILTSVCAVGAQGLAIGAKMDNFSLPDTNGKVHTLSELTGKNGAVIMFLSAQCPVVKQYNDRINKLAADYSAKGIKFIGINSNATESLEWIKSDAAEVGYKFPLLIDKGNVLADKLAATVTPEAYFVDAKNVLLYHGRIDNNRAGTDITATDLRDAFEAALAGKTIERAKVAAFGCSIKRG